MPYTGPGFLLARAVFQDVDGLPADEVENSFVCHDENTGGTGPGLWAGHVRDFFTTAPAGMTQTIGAWLSPTLTRVGTPDRVDVYDLTAHLDGSPHGTPILSLPFDITGPSSTFEMPGQIAVTLAFHADDAAIPERTPGATIPTEDEAVDVGAPSTHPGTARTKSRARGRVYIGPLNRDSLQSSGQPSSALVADLNIAAENLLVTSIVSNTLWGVWSRRDALVRPVIGGWVDNEFTTQRRRREKPTVRTLWP
jgi:hypothetical protein